VKTIPRLISRTKREPKLDEGEHPATVAEVEDENGVETQYGIKDRYVISYAINGVVVRKRYTKSLFPKSNLYKLITTLDGDNFDGENYDVDNLVDKPCRVVITHSINEETGDVWERIETVLKPRYKSPSSLEDLAAMDDRGER
jgi:hypothetical protein